MSSTPSLISVSCQWRPGPPFVSKRATVPGGPYSTVRSGIRASLAPHHSVAHTPNQAGNGLPPRRLRHSSGSDGSAPRYSTTSPVVRSTAAGAVAHATGLTVATGETDAQPANDPANPRLGPILRNMWHSWTRWIFPFGVYNPDQAYGLSVTHVVLSDAHGAIAEQGASESSAW